MDTNRLKQLRADTELKRDLWPDMRRRMDERTLRVSLIDWALIAAVLATIAAFPESALALLYHL
jgi:hypothetical protein